MNEDMDQETNADWMERLSTAVIALEAMLDKQTAVAACAGEDVGKIVATAASAREQELESLLAEAQSTIAGLKAQSTPAPAGRKTAIAASMQAKHAAEAVDARSLDGALTSLSIEQRLAVKAELLRCGLLR